MMAVKFSMIFEAQMADPSRETEQQVIRDCVDQAVLAEEVGIGALVLGFAGADEIRLMKETYDDAIRYVSELEAVGCDEIMCMIQMGTIPQEVMLETIRQFGHHVIPHFRAKEETAVASCRLTYTETN